MPSPGDLHHCVLCGPKGSTRRAREAGLCKHKKKCSGTSAQPHNEWIMYKTESCKLCKLNAETAHRKEQEKRAEDDKKDKERGADAWYHEKPGRKKPGTRR